MNDVSAAIEILKSFRSMQGVGWVYEDSFMAKIGKVGRPPAARALRFSRRRPLIGGRHRPCAGEDEAPLSMKPQDEKSENQKAQEKQAAKVRRSH